MGMASQVMAMAPSQVVMHESQPQVMAGAMEGCGGQGGDYCRAHRTRGVVGYCAWGCAFVSRG